MPKDDTDSKPNNLSERVLGSIRTRSVRMRPRSYYVTLSVLATLGAIILIGLSALLTHLLMNDIDNIRQIDFLSFGPAGRSIIIEHFPWILLTLTMMFIIITVYFLRRYDISYKRNLKIFYLGIIGLVGMTSVVIGIFGLEESFDEKGVFNSIRTLNQAVEDHEVEGQILSESPGMLTIVSDGDVKWIRISDDKLSEDCEVGSTLEAVGEWDEESENTFDADSIHVEPSDEMGE